MAQTRYYSSTAQPTVLVNTITPTTTTIQLQQVIGFPVNTPFVIALDYNTAGEELALVTLVAGTTLTITRAFDGTSAASHNVGAGVRHVSCAVDFNDSRLHESLSAGVHGVVGTVVGTTDTQTLTNKTISGANINGVINGTPTWNSSQNFGNGATFTNGFSAGSTNQLTVDSSGDINTSGTLIAAGSTLSSLAVTNGATVGANLSVGGNLTVTGVGQIFSTRKTADTSRASTTSLTADPDLTGMSVPANAVYRVQGTIFYSAHQSADLALQFAAPSGSSMVWHGHCQATTNTGTTGVSIYDCQTISTVYQPGGADTTNTPVLILLVNGTLTIGGTAGSFGITWAQAASNTTATILRNGSTLTLTRIA